MPIQTTINDAAIRAASVIVERLAQNITAQAVLLRQQFDALYPNLQFADPVRDVALDRYLLTMAHVKMLCDQMPSLAYQARKMQQYGKQQLAADVSNLSRLTPSTVDAASCRVLQPT